MSRWACVDALAAIDRQQQYDAMEEELLGARDPESLERIDADAAAGPRRATRPLRTSSSCAS